MRVAPALFKQQQQQQPLQRRRWRRWRRWRGFFLISHGAALTIHLAGQETAAAEQAQPPHGY